MQDVRPGQATSIQRVHQETNNFLGFIQNSNYSSVSNVVPSGDQAYLYGLGLDSTSNALTMALPAVLPFTIILPDSSYKRRTQITLLVNPESINHGKTNLTGSSYTRKGFVTQYWGPGQDLLTGNGRSAAFMTPETGITVKAEQRSFGFQNFMSLFSAYRNNGYHFLDPTSPLLTRVIHVINGIEISYDGHIFMGHFNNFTIDQNAENPFYINYNFEFVISTLDTAYREIRGHFIPIPASNTEEAEAPAKKLEDIGKK